MATRCSFLTFHGITDRTQPAEPSLNRYSIGSSLFLQILDLAVCNPEVKITFDDGNVSDYLVALPALLERNLSAMFFVASELIGQTGYMSKEQLRCLVTNGFEIGSHGALHRDWRMLSVNELDREINCARKDLQDWLGLQIRYVSVPFGSYDRRVLASLEQAGFDHVYTSDGGTANTGSWIQPRNTIHGKYSVAGVARLLNYVARPYPDLKRAIKMFVKKWR